MNENKPQVVENPAVAPSLLSAGLGLLPCAHCGGTANLHQQKNNDGEGGWFIECDDHRCWMSTPLKFAIMEDVAPILTEIWNRRPVPNMQGKGLADHSTTKER